MFHSSVVYNISVHQMNANVEKSNHQIHADTWCIVVCYPFAIFTYIQSLWVLNDWHIELTCTCKVSGSLFANLSMPTTLP